MLFSLLGVVPGIRRLLGPATSRHLFFFTPEVLDPKPKARQPFSNTVSSRVQGTDPAPQIQISSEQPVPTQPQIKTLNPLRGWSAKLSDATYDLFMRL